MQRLPDPTALSCLPSHHWAARRGAFFMDVGLRKHVQWHRLPVGKDWLKSVNLGVLGVCNGVGFCDFSTLGKIDMQGSDAGLFLYRVYIITFSKIVVDSAMLRHDGLVMDDEGYSFVTTTTANAGPLMQHVKFCRQVQWPELDVQLALAIDQ
jgi:sarcosine oxidase subunit alpha